MEITAVIEKTSGLDVAKFNLNDLLNHIDDVKLVVLQDMEADCVVRRSTGKYLERAEISSDDIVLFHSRDIEFRSPPKRSESPKSAAEYYIWDDKTGILLQRIPPYSYTSFNLHTKGSELFYNIKGKCRICICYYPDLKTSKGAFYKGDISLNDINPFTAESYHCHKLHSLSSSVFNIILMPPSVGTSDHHYPERCIKELSYLLPERCAGAYVEQKAA